MSDSRTYVSARKKLGEQASCLFGECNGKTRLRYGYGEAGGSATLLSLGALTSSSARNMARAVKADEDVGVPRK